MRNDNGQVMFNKYEQFEQIVILWEVLEKVGESVDADDSLTRAEDQDMQTTRLDCFRKTR